MLRYLNNSHQHSVLYPLLWNQFNPFCTRLFFKKWVQLSYYISL